jgi:hypothetical protein
MEKTMKTRFLLSVLLLSTAMAVPASANWFSNPQLGINRFVGSAPNPRPEDIRNNVQPILVRDANGNVIAMIDPVTGKRTEIASAAPATQPEAGNAGSAVATTTR